MIGKVIKMDAAMLLARAQREMKPEKKQKLLLEAEKAEENNLAIQRELLLLGDFSRYPKGTMRRIKCYLFHAFEHPEAHSEEEQEAMAREIFHHPRLEKCLALAPDGDAFRREYLSLLSSKYIEIFILGDTSHMPSMLGFTVTRNVPKYLALPMADVIRNIFLCPFLDENEQSLLAGCFYRACYQHLEGQTAPLDENLGAEISALIQ